MSPALQRGARTLSWTRVVPKTHRQVRFVQIRATPSAEPTVNGDHLPLAGTPSFAESRDARFDVVGAPYSLLSVSLSASQNLYTRRGTLVGLSGKADNVVSTLSVLEPFRRAPLGVPFLYQKVSSASPVTALISVRSPTTSFAVVNLNGSVDWMVAQRRALLAWTGRSLSIKPTIDTSLSMAHWGSSAVTGRGLIALVGQGQVYSVELKQGEQYIVHPSNVVAYTMSSDPPRPYRFKSTTLSFQVPGLKSLPRLLQKSKFVRDVSASQGWKKTMSILHRIRTWSRMTFWGDRLFLQFDGPATVLMQSRGPRVNDILSERQITELADAPRGISIRPDQHEVRKATPTEAEISRTVESLNNELLGIRQSVAEIRKDGSVEIKETGRTDSKAL
ncbi:Altered inheritance of mitochondria protein 24, mitochondrial [Penicillium ucsense]|uniref:Altered inheritance of mitochondria protein 24, mitochondrial n=1 Tax=Penicillium ucsense TaxID=2839758 RepID=A0A8J8W3E3_9EURO|nr:Altered inheritance of mitochondria protein 24, mitochondrial [Penicillium ucsense]KAF7735925.1 Altered inheritance of mitochondria protein 24, mitochondrial [Penicillium ucsense]